MFIRNIRSPIEEASVLSLYLSRSSSFICYMFLYLFFFSCSVFCLFVPSFFLSLSASLSVFLSFSLSVYNICIHIYIYMLKYETIYAYTFTVLPYTISNGCLCAWDIVISLEHITVHCSHTLKNTIQNQPDLRNHKGT